MTSHMPCVASFFPTKHSAWTESVWPWTMKADRLWVVHACTTARPGTTCGQRKVKADMRHLMSNQQTYSAAIYGCSFVSQFSPSHSHGPFDFQRFNISSPDFLHRDVTFSWNHNNFHQAGVVRVLNCHEKAIKQVTCDIDHLLRPVRTPTPRTDTVNHQRIDTAKQSAHSATPHY